MKRRTISTLVTSLGVLGLLSACGGNGNDVDVNLDGSMDVETEEGTAKIGTQDMPNNWPEDAPGAYPGSTVSYSASMDPESGKPDMAIVSTTTDAAATVAAHYKTALAEKGWAVGTTMEGAGTSIFSATKDTRTMSLLITGTGQGQTTVTMAIEIEETE